MLQITPLYTDFETQNGLITSWLPEEDYDKFSYPDIVAMYDICYAYCYANSLRKSGTKADMFSVLTSKKLPGGKSLLNNLSILLGQMGDISFDSNTNYIRDMALLHFQDPDVNNFATLSTARPVPAPCTEFTCSGVAFDPANFNIWQDQLTSEINPCYYNGGCTSYTLPLVGVVLLILISAVLGGRYIYKRR